MAKNNGTAPLSGKRRDFCEQFVIDHNGAAAARRAGYSAKTAKEQAARLLTNVHVAAEIARLEAAQKKRLRLEADDVLATAMAVAYADLGDLVEWGPRGVQLVPSKKLTREQRLAVASVTEHRHARTGRVTSLGIKLGDRIAALMLLARKLRLFDAQGAVTDRHLDAMVEAMAEVLQKFVDPSRVKEAVLEMTRVAARRYLEAPREGEA